MGNLKLQRLKEFFKQKSVFVLLLIVSYFGILSFGVVVKNQGLFPQKTDIKNKSENLQNNSDNVLGMGYSRPPQIYIIGGEQGYAAGGMIALASTDEPAVEIGGYNISGIADVTMYEANETLLLDYLTHDKNGKQTKKNPDISQLKFITNIKQPLSNASNQTTKVTLPFAETGIWYLKINIGSKNVDSFVLRSNMGVVAKEGDGEFIFWGQNFKSKRSLSEGSIKVMNLLDSQKELQSVSFDSTGISKANLTAEADVALVSLNNDRAIVPLNLRYLNSGYTYRQFQPKARITRYFTFTDRPLYKPGDTINFKSVLRDDDDVRYSIPSGEATVKIYDGYYYGGNDNPIYQKNLPITSDGTISGQYQLPVNSKVGYYSITVTLPNQASRASFFDMEWSSNTVSFLVQYYRKPEFTIDVTASKTELIAGDKTSFKINGNYFSGQPLLGQKVKYTVYSADFYEYQYLVEQQNYSQNISDQYRYNSWYGPNKITEGVATLNNNGEAEIDLNTIMTLNAGRSQVFSIEATIEDGSQNPAFSRRNVLVFAGEYGIYRKDTSYGSKINTPLSIPVALKSYRSNISLSNISLTAKIHRTNWISYLQPDQKYPQYKKEEEDLQSLSSTTDSSGNAEFTFTPSKVGSYAVTVEGKDARGNLVSKIFYSYVSTEDQPTYAEGGNVYLTIFADKQKYLPNDIAQFNIYSQIPDRDVLLSFQRGRVNRFQIVHLNGKNGSVQVPLVNTDIPNMYAEVQSFSDSKLDSGNTNLNVSSESKKLVVSVTPDNKSYGPGETVNLNVSTTDVAGNPVSSELAVWTVDKALFELSDNRLGNIFDTFWRTRSDTTQESHSLEGIVVSGAEGGGCFAAGTQVLMSDGKTKSIEDVRKGEYVYTRAENDTKLIKAKVVETHSHDSSGYLIINGNLRLTVNHILRVNDKWLEAGSIQIGDYLIGEDGKKITVNSIEWLRGKSIVYNLGIEKYHTYFANGVWVHNEKGGVDRNVFKDVAYWNSSVRTDASGRAKVSFKLPDNLTTWTIAAVAATTDTRVGQTTNEIVVSKDVVVRTVLPNIMRTGDEIYLSAIVQNFTASDQTFNVDLKFDSGDVDDALKNNILIPSNGTTQLYWKVRPTKVNSQSKVVIGAKVIGNEKIGDVVTSGVPVRPFGFEEKRAEFSEGSKNFDLKLSDGSNKDRSTISLSLSPTMLGSLPTAMKYLIDYPYGCVEQTTSRFVPAVVAKANLSIFSDALKDKKIDEIIQKGVNRLESLQNRGWSWWSTGNPDSYLTSYVVENLLLAKQLGATVNDYVFDNAKYFLEETERYDSSVQKVVSYGREEIIARNYGLTLLGDKSKVNKITDFENLSPDLLALAVMSNYLNGDKNAQTNGLSKLVSTAQVQGDAVFWEAGKKLNFGSKDASTALAIRAIVLAGGDRNLAIKGARYLTRVRKFDYWSNTFATAQVIRALVDLSKTGEELVPNYSYVVSLDGKQLTQGSVTNSKQQIANIEIPIKNLKDTGSKLSVTKTGEGQLYSTLVVSDFHTDKSAKSLDNGLRITRKYVNEKGPQYSLGVGDVALVQITVSGLKADENYGVINDELPSGLVPINLSFKNEQYGNNSIDNFYTQVSNGDITENGMVLSVYRLYSGEYTYTYKARVINQGTFIVPPATVSLMYAPEIYGRSDVQTVVVTKESEVSAIDKGIQTVNQFDQQTIVAIGIIVLGLICGFLILKKRKITLSSIKQAIKKIFKRDDSGPSNPLERRVPVSQDPPLK